MVQRAVLTGEVARRLITVATVASLWLACTPSGLGQTCHFSGDDSSPCGICIAANCQTQVNACCGNDDCASELATIDACATGSSCSGLTSTSADLATCVASSCAMCNEARAPDAGSDAEDVDAHDAGPRFTSNCSTPTSTGCICSPKGGGSDECSEAAVNGGLCCADRGWPEAGDTLCSCEPFTCEQVFDSPFVTLRCELRDLHTGITEGTGALCCINVFLGSCRCGPSDMGCNDEDVVPRCNAQAMRCISSRSRVKTCSF
ncbi:MAG TPA: hypothetical protein VM925_32650 [Labilithrix sp.]|nr:hypothetical protein [Labilithrix sp.]